jgi:hypothetical protein
MGQLGHPIQQQQPEAKRWLVEEKLKHGSIKWACFEHEHDARAYAKGALGPVVVTPLFASPQPPTPAGVMEEAETLLIYLRGCLSREDGDGMIDVPADYIKRAIPLVAAAKGAGE